MNAAFEDRGYLCESGGNPKGHTTKTDDDAGCKPALIREFLDFGKFAIYFLIRRGGRIKLPRIAFIRSSQALSERRSFH